MIRLDTLFADVGGVCLTNGWDADARLAAASHVVLDTWASLVGISMSPIASTHDRTESLGFVGRAP